MSDETPPEPESLPEPPQIRPEELLTERRYKAVAEIIRRPFGLGEYTAGEIVDAIAPILVPGAISDANAMVAEIADLRAMNEALATTLEIASLQASKVDEQRAEHAAQIRKIDAELGEVIAGLRGQVEGLTTDLEIAKDGLREYGETFNVLKPALDRQRAILDRLKLSNFPNIPDALSDYVEGLLNAPKAQAVITKDILTVQEYRRNQRTHTQILMETLTNIRLAIESIRREQGNADPEES